MSRNNCVRGAAIGLQLIGHGVEIPRQHREFVLAPLESRADAHVELLGFSGERARALLECAESARSSAAPATSWRARSRSARCTGWSAEMPGRLNAPKMLGRRGTNRTCRPNRPPTICGAWREGRKFSGGARSPSPRLQSRRLDAGNWTRD
jgi:hypothetical protein